MTDDSLALQAGLGIDFLKSVPELWRIYKNAIDNGYLPDRFMQEIQGSNWFKNTPESERRAQLLKFSDPAEHGNRRDKVSSEIEALARGLGLSLTGSSLRSLRDLAFINNWSQSQIENYLRGTPDYRRRSESQREIEQLKADNPAEFDARMKKIRAEVMRISRETGLGRQSSQITATAELALLNNWTETQIRNHLASHGEVEQRVRDGKGLTGDAAAARRLVQQLSQDYGINVSTGRLARMVANIAEGKWDENYARDWFMTKAKAEYAAMADEIEAGFTVREIAEPYVDSMAQLLELNPSDVNIRDPMVRRAITQRGELENLGDFENRVRKDKRWMSTSNARESMMGTGREVLSQMGLMI